MADQTLKQQRAALLVQAILEHWPMSNAHMKRPPAGGEPVLVLREYMQRDIEEMIRLFAAAWVLGFDAATKLAASWAPFGEAAPPAPPKRRGDSAGKRPARRHGQEPPMSPRRSEAAAAALAGLERLFQGSEGGGS